MRLLKGYIGRSVFGAVLLVLLVIVALDVISSLVDQIVDMGGGYNLLEVGIFVGLSVPSMIYEYLPLSSLVGCLVGLGLLATSSELVVMRAAGVSILQIIWGVFRPVLVLIAMGALIGEFVAPYADQYADSRRALALGHEGALRSNLGKWNREGNEFMHFNAVLPNGKLFGITRFRFDDENRLVESRFAESAIYQGDHWVEQNIASTLFTPGGIQTESRSNDRWFSDVSPALLNVLVLEAEDLPMKRLNDYANYLEKQSQDASEYRLAFWQKALQPLATLSLVMIAISFILGPLRQVTMGFRVFVGVLIGLIFQMSQKLLGPSSIIWGFPPVMAVLVPIMVCFLVGIVLIRRAE